MPRIEAEIVFLSAEEGGRRVPLTQLSSRMYCPHLLVEDPSVRKAPNQEEIRKYLGIAFLSGPDSIPAGVPFSAELGLMYHPVVDYSELIPGATFTIREGGKVVGYGKIIRRLADVQ